MKIWTEAYGWANDAPPVAETGHLRIVTKQGRYTLQELPDGVLSINGGGPRNAFTHNVGFAIIPKSGNDFLLCYEPRTHPPTPEGARLRERLCELADKCRDVADADDGRCLSDAEHSEIASLLLRPEPS